KKQREELGSLAYRYTRPILLKLGRPLKVIKAVYKKLVSPLRNLVRNQPYKA
ncbi:hypothetical protein V2W45_1246682, partial [Cenococcum geophilum]